ncbi:MAG: hypothetical protein IPO66_04065 [Rhodanobacteraceae bacterium]|nr:hypothetical protein [Rhodanobacteraceae bacterium]
MATRGEDIHPHRPPGAATTWRFARGLLTALLISSTLASAQQPARFSGGGGLSVDAVQLSADQRFSLSAELQAASTPEKASSDGRFALNAALAANKALATACGPQVDLMFKNGFE